ncbi:hypothetical protein PC116_g12188 [Phytophthora cactorum]|uniref:Uncharacterized protein n=1 Tax=Phytophthora cactorum TaxID=29920 RepID=A0A329S847_9STRA|nr:hypothetical protein Pcac1_g17765 [Phytophthora cactorum]KAG2799743.1 hypothetical protein PC112_g20771 [Phytophthora cactorum]KAG2828166.1 hypothetical protein PC111_g8272 [Phytophthora cactorum]KAG2850898.1 hypothetical protein PC113_g16375 [Phytophthora cactorum]KAG2878659.1 hypothetical protein PC114_g22978 [Phytophthora cactorum]
MPPVKKRKATNTVRREEAEALRKQMAVLQNQVHKLQAQAEQAVMTPSDHLQLLTRSLRTKNVLQELLQDQKMVLAGAQSELMDFQEKRVINPLYTYIHLPRCWDKRKQTLIDLKDEKLTKALQYIHARSKNLNLEARHSSEDRYKDADGNFCCNRFEVNHLVGVKSLKEVYDAAKFFLTNVEISTTEALGNITVREDYDTVGNDESIGSFRLISARPSGIVTESHKVLYDKYYDHHTLLDGRPCLVMVTDSVDKDDLHPYDPKSRVRLDVSATLFMTEMRQKQPRGRKKDITGGFDCVQGTAGATADDEEGEKEMIVVIQSAVFLKAVSPQIDVRADALSAIGDGTASWIRVMLQSIREFVDAL